VYVIIIVGGSGGGDSCGNARSVRRNKPRVSEGCGLRVCPRKATAVADTNIIAKMVGLLAFSRYAKWMKP